MCSTTLILQLTNIRTAPRAGVACREICLPLQEAHRTEFRPLQARWAVDLDENGNRQLSLRWTAEE